MKEYISRNISMPCIIIQENVALYANNEFEILTSYSIKELIGKSMIEIIKLLNADSQIKLEDINDKCGFYIFTKECNPREVKVSCNEIIEENKYIYYFNEIRIIKFEENYPYLFSVLPDNNIAFALYSVPKGILLKANKKYINYLNDICNNDTNKIGRPINEFIPNYKGSSYEHSFTEVMETGIPKYFKDYNDYSYQDGNKYWDGSLIPVFRKGKMKHIFHIGIDVTDRVIGRMTIERQKNELLRQKEELDEQRQELEAIIENISDEVAIFDKHGNVTINKITRDTAIYDVETTKNIAGFSKLDILYDMDNNLIPFEDTLTNRVIRGETIRNVKIMKKKGDIKQIREVNGTPIYDDNGNFKFGVLISRDISERIKQEENILIRKEYEILKETIKIQDELYANVSHELRTPLNVIFSANQFMDVLLNGCSLELNKEKLVSYSTMIKQNCYRLTKLINNILDLSKGKSGFLKVNLSNENIVGLVKDLVDSISEYTELKKLRIIFQSNINERVIACDPYLIERVMLNLISNAIKFSKPDSDIDIKIVNKEDSIEILVIDTGIGMDEKTLKYLFKRYYQADMSLTRKTEGSGIGLSLVKTIVELHGGNIKVVSAFNKGSTFIVELPAAVTSDSLIERNHYSDLIEMINIEFSDI